MQVLPLFPLGVVLFPGTKMPLHIFEPRYQALVRDCLAEGSLFAVVALKGGSETDPEAVCYEVGTLAKIERVVRLPRGRLNLTVSGQTRFQTVRRVDGRPYLRAEVEPMETFLARSSPLFVAAQVRVAYDRYRDALRGLRVSIPQFAELPRDAVDLSWAIADHLIVELSAKQGLLEESDPMARIRREVMLLRRESTLLGRRLANRLVGTPSYSLN